MDRSSAMHIMHPISARKGEPSRAVHRIARDGSAENDTSFPLQTSPSVHGAPVVANQQLPLRHFGMTFELLAVSQLVPLVESFVPLPESVVAESEGRPVDLVVLHAGELAIRSSVEDRRACCKRDVPSLIVLQLPPSVH